jgi:hypothetical protein
MHAIHSFLHALSYLGASGDLLFSHLMHAFSYLGASGD